MDKYEKLKAVQGLIQGLDEQFYRLDNHPDPKIKTKEMYARIMNQFYNAILEVLSKKDENEKE